MLARAGGAVSPTQSAGDRRVADWSDAIRRGPDAGWGSLDGRPTLASPVGSFTADGGAGTVHVRHADGRAAAELDGRLYRAPAMAFSRDGRSFAAGSWQGGITLVDLSTGRRLEFGTPDRNRTPLALSPDGRLLASVGKRVSGRPPAWFARLPLWAQRRAYPHVIRGNGYDPLDRAALWDARTGELRAVLPGHDSDICAIAFSPDGRSLATSDWGGNVRIWDVP